MKLSFKKLCCMGMALLFSFGLSNASLGVKASAEPSAIVEKKSTAVQTDANGNFVITKEMMQELIDQRMKNAKSDKNALVAFILDFFAGPLGLHRFYVGKWGTGVLYLCTCGLLGIGCIYDAIMIVTENFEDYKNLPVKF